jgi:hypothetical protein
LKVEASGFYRVVVFGQRLYLTEPNATELWSNAANPVGFAFMRASVIPVGLNAGDLRE